MADKNQSEILQKIRNLCSKYNSSSMILNENKSKAFTSHVNQNTYEPFADHRLLQSF